LQKGDPMFSTQTTNTGTTGLDRVSGHSPRSTTGAAPGVLRLGSRGLWQRRRPPVRYHARGRVGRNDRIFIDRSVHVDIYNDDDESATNGMSAASELHQRYGGRSGPAVGRKKAKVDTKITSRVIERKYVYGMFNRLPEAPIASVVPKIPSSSMWSDQRDISSAIDAVPGTSDGTRRYLYASPHPLDSGQKFYDVARTMSEQVPALTATMKHLIPSVFMACENIASTQPIVSAASSAAGTAKSKLLLLLLLLLLYVIFFHAHVVSASSFFSQHK
jgi:hypothetical protein